MRKRIRYSPTPVVIPELPSDQHNCKQNLPSRDKMYPVKNIYCPPEGAILCATDFSFIELVALAESCIQRFGHSVLGDVINAQVDPHRWFAGVRKKIITNDTSFLKDPEKAAELEEFLKANVSKKERQDAKPANFGFGGGMAAERFYENCREQGMKLTLEEAAEMREDWINAFTEMSQHMRATPIHETTSTMRYFGMDDDEDEEEEDNGDGKPKQLFKAVLINGMVRNRCSYCSALNIQFQGIAAYGMKMAMWNMAMAGYLPRMVNMIH